MLFAFLEQIQHTIQVHFLPEGKLVLRLCQIIEEQIQMRMERATWEMKQRVWYDHVVVNDDPERCAQEILKIIAE